MDFGFPKSVFTWVASYLSKRTQRVQVGDLKSDWSSVTSGVPQGSVVGPVLFVLATDSFSSLCTNSRVIRYADDITIAHFLRNETEDNLQLEWTNLVEWSKSHHLQLNWSKCAVMDIVTKKNISLRTVVTTEGSSLPKHSSLSLLGVHFSDNCKWNVHVENIVRKASKRIFVIRDLKRAGCSKSILFSAYKAFIRSVLLYCFPVFCNVPVYLFSCIERVERRVFRLIGADTANFDFIRDSAESVCKRLFYKVANDPDHPLRSLFLNRVPTARNNSELKPPFARTSRFKNTFIRFGV